MMKTVDASHRINKGVGEGSKPPQLFTPWLFHNYPGYYFLTVYWMSLSGGGVSLEFILERTDLT